MLTPTSITRWVGGTGRCVECSHFVLEPERRRRVHDHVQLVGFDQHRQHRCFQQPGLSDQRRAHDVLQRVHRLFRLEKVDTAAHATVTIQPRTLWTASEPIGHGIPCHCLRHGKI